MFNLFNIEEPPHSVVFRDLTLGALGLFIIMFIMIVIYVNPPTQEEEVTVASTAGNTLIFIFWPNKDIKADIDLWVWNEEEGKPVGYSNRNGNRLDLLRDELGHLNDFIDINIENLVARGVVNKKWIINLHYYSTASSETPPITVKVIAETIVKTESELSDRKIVLLEREVILTEVGEEVTVASFIMTEEGTIYEETLDIVTQYSLRGRVDSDYDF